ncbi:MAG: Gfo/Idh/MocA family oxidoreductase [Candidatus Omnitrophica bacterium]|nr:Gfo/Idh/MocA family oxidoreductase [Candidatus Omnitrophota bacterium]
MATLRAAVIGMGHVGKEHTRLYNQMKDQVELVGICDVDSAKEEKARELGVPFFKDYRKVLSNVDLVSISVPTSLHHDIALQCLKQDIHCLIEKPISTSLEQADELLDEARSRNLLLQVGHVERYNSGFQEIAKIVKNPRFIEIHRLGPFNPRINDVGVVLDLMIHDLDILLSLVHEDVTQVEAIGIPVLTKFEDIANARLKFSNGCIVDMTASRLTPERQRKIRIFQPDAYISLDYAEQKAKVYRKEFFSISSKEVDIEKGESLKKELEDFVRKVTEKKDFGYPDVAARNALALAIRILDSIQEFGEETKASLKKAKV